MSQSQKKIRFALLGLGQIGKRHARIIAHHPQAELVALADVNENEKHWLTEIGSPPFFLSPDELLKSPTEIDVVSIATPNSMHAAQAVAALRRGSHVLIEKPMGLTKASCEEVIHCALQKSKLVFCVMQNRYSPPAQWLRSVVDQQLLGKIYLVQINCYWNRDDRYYRPGARDPYFWKGMKESDGGPLFTQFSHFIDMMYWLFGDLKKIKTTFGNVAHRHSTEFDDDTGFITFEFNSGALGSFNYSTAVWDKNLESSLTIIAENGSIKVGGQYMERVEYCHLRDYQLPPLAPPDPPNNYGTHTGSAANHHQVIQNVIDTLTGKSTITTNALEGMKVVEIIERIYGSAS